MPKAQASGCSQYCALPLQLTDILKDFFKKDPSRTLNATEVISRGCALNCAMLSPIFRSGDLPELHSYSSLHY